MSPAVLWPASGGCAGFRARPSVQETAHQRRLVHRAVAHAKEGDRDALRFLYIRYSDNVYGYVRSIVHSDHDAEDVTQHVFAKLMTVLVQYDERGVPFFAWLLRLAHHAAIDHLRSCRTTPAPEVFGSDARADDATTDRSRSLREALAVLPDEQRAVVVLRHVLGLSPGEIATTLGRTESSVHGLHHRGRRALQAELAGRGSAPSIAVARAAA